MSKAALAARQAAVLDRIAALERAVQSRRLSSLSLASSVTELDTESRLSAILAAAGVADFAFRRVVSNYYDRTLEERKFLLGANSIEQLCKSIVMVNTQASPDVVDCSDPKNSKYYLVIVQYIARLNADSIKNFLYNLNDKKIPKKRFNLRLAPEDKSNELTGFEHNAVTCVGTATKIPIIIDEAITKLEEDFFWLGGGEVDLKLGMRTSQFLRSFKPFVVTCS